MKAEVARKMAIDALREEYKVTITEIYEKIAIQSIQGNFKADYTIKQLSALSVDRICSVLRYDKYKATNIYSGFKILIEWGDTLS